MIFQKTFKGRYLFFMVLEAGSSIGQGFHVAHSIAEGRRVREGETIQG